MGRHTPLYQIHVEAGARMVDFAGWDMPIHYGSQISEHHAVRRGAGMFDVSHMTVVDLSGPGARGFLERLLANDVGKLKTPGAALYTCMLNPEGGVIDDLIAYLVGDGAYRLVVNAATRDKDLAWMGSRAAGFEVSIRERGDLAMVAVQGPKARGAVHRVLSPTLTPAVEGLGRFKAAWADEVFVARTGYTGEDGYEIILPAAREVDLWTRLAAAGVVPVGLGARDTLRLEAGLNLYGSDMDEGVSPLESNLAWTVAWSPPEREFVGRQSLERQRSEGPKVVLRGLVLEDKGVLRGHLPVYCDGGTGEVTSGTFSPTLGRAVGLARVPAGSHGRVTVEIRGKRVPARLVDPPFVRSGEATFSL